MLNISKKTKIICTIGPASDNYETLCALIEAGMNVMRINFSHGSYDEHLHKINLLRQICKEKGIFIPIMLDTKGPEIRTGLMENDAIEVKDGSTIRVAMEPVLGTPEKISVSYQELFEDVKVSDHIKIDDGNLDLIITGKDEEHRELICRVTNDHILKSRKGCNIPYAKLSMPFISELDEADLKFGCENNLDMIAASFTRRPKDIHAIKEILAKYGKPNIPVYAKIENPEGVENVDRIIEVSDGIMVARGDLGVEVPPEEVPVIQKHLINQCRLKGKPVITATQMLESMTTHPRPTRAEVSDVATAISESSDCVMLSAESASGKYPVQAVEMQAKIARTMEQYLNYEELAREAYESSEKNNNDAIANSIANTALLIGAKLIISYTETGASTNRIAKARPCCPIVSVSNNIDTVLRSGTVWGVYSHYIKTPMPDFIEEMEVLALKIAHDLHIRAGSPIIVVGGTPTGAGKTNFMRIINVNEIANFKL